jgi:UDP-N-acetylenolpyruvoylglucosamine reductase
MARKTPQTAAAKPNKSAFVRSLSFDMPSAEVVARARTRGMKLTPSDVHAIRAIARRKNQSARPSSSNRGRATSSINKSAFVRSLPGTMSAAEVIEKGKAKGIKLSAAQVYTIRANARRKRPDTDKEEIVLPAKLKLAGRKRSGKSSESKEAEFIATALDLGLARAEALLHALRSRASSGWS